MSTSTTVRIPQRGQLLQEPLWPKWVSTARNSAVSSFRYLQGGFSSLAEMAVGCCLVVAALALCYFVILLSSTF